MTEYMVGDRRDSQTIAEIKISLTKEGLLAMLTAFQREEDLAHIEGRTKDAAMFSDMIQSFRDAAAENQH